MENIETPDSVKSITESNLKMSLIRNIEILMIKRFYDLYSFSAS